MPNEPAPPGVPQPRPAAPRRGSWGNLVWLALILLWIAAVTTIVVITVVLKMGGEEALQTQPGANAPPGFGAPAQTEPATPLDPATAPLNPGD